MAEQLSKEVQDMYKDVKALSKSYKSLSKAEFVKSGSVVFDALLGGGIPRGVFILWSSESGCGKSTGALHIAKAYCVQGLRVLYLDYEGGVNVSQIRGIGLESFLWDADTNPTGQFILFQCQTYKDGEKILDKLMATVDLVVIDSMTAMTPEKLKEASAEDSLPGLDARIVSAFMKKYKAEAVRNGVTWIMINQLRTRIAMGYGQVTTVQEAGGQAIQFYPDVRLWMKKDYKGDIEKEEVTSNGIQKVPYGKICVIWAIKNRYERPNIPLKLAVIFGQGIENSYAYYYFLENDGAITKSGAWYEIKFGNFCEKVNGMNRAIDFISAHKQEVKDYIDSKGGFKLLLNSSKAVDIGGSDDSEDLNKSVVDDFDSISSEYDLAEDKNEGKEDEVVADE